MTKDERLLLELFKAAPRNPNTPFNPKPVIKRLGYKEHIVKEIFKGLAKANLIKVFSPNEILVTEGGRALARSLQTT
jgi:Mn-dependent DtxR family transcriptional regulator